MKYLLAILFTLSLVNGCGYASKHHDTSSDHSVAGHCCEPCGHCDQDHDGQCDQPNCHCPCHDGSCPDDGCCDHCPDGCVDQDGDGHCDDCDCDCGGGSCPDDGCCDHCPDGCVDQDGDGHCDCCDCDCDCSGGGCHPGDDCDCPCDDGCCDDGSCDGCPNCDCGDGCCDHDDRTTETAAQNISAFELPNMNANGAMWKSSEHPGVYLFENYFLGCPYCNDNAPNVDAMAQSYAENVLVHVVDLGIDRSDSQYATWISRHHPDHPVLKDANRTVTSQLGTSGYPSAYVVDCEMKVVYSTTGVWNDSKKQAIRNAINSAVESCDTVIPVAK